MVRLSRWLLRSPAPTRRPARVPVLVERLEDRLVPAGSVTSQGDAAILASQVRQLLGLDGSGVTIGVISDSYDRLNGASADVASGDLPGPGNPAGHFTPVEVRGEDGPGGRDEGRAMLQIVHDVAPGARLLFAAAGTTQVQLAASIRDLANAGADIIVDDVTFAAEPMFQDGLVAQAVAHAAAAGVVYFSAAGNLGRQSYDSGYRNSGVNLVTADGGPLLIKQADTGRDTFLAHDFDPGPGVDLFQTVTLPAGRTTFSFQWADRYASAEGSGSPGARTDMDLALFDMNGAFVRLVTATGGAGGFSANAGGDPVEVFDVDAGAGGQYQIALGKFSGPDPELLKYVAFADGFRADEWATDSSTVFGHANVTSGAAVGAVAIDPLSARPYTGAGGTPILFDAAGNALTPATRPNPRFAAPDGVDTTFFGNPTFVGTSAAAPHAAGVAALMLQANPGLSPQQVFDALSATALDVGPAGFDADTGAGLIQALPAVLAVGNSFDVTLDGTDGNDAFLARRDSSGADVEFFKNGDLILRVPVAKLGRVTVHGGAGSDSLTLDYVNGAPVASAGLSFAGGESAGDDDRIVFDGYNVTTVVLSHDGPETGTVQVGTTGLVSFAEVEPVLLAGIAADLIVNLPTMPNPDVAVGDDGGAADPDGPAGVSGFSAVSGSTFEYTRFRNPTHSLVVGLGSGGDTVVLRAMDAAFAPAVVRIAGGSGADEVVVRGGAGDDAVGYTPAASDGGDVTLTHGGAVSRFTLTGVESLTADGLGQGSADAVTVTAPRAAVVFGLVAGSGTVSPAAAGGSAWLALAYRNFERAAVAAVGTVTVAGTDGDDAITVTADGSVTVTPAGGVAHAVDVTADRLDLDALAGADQVTVAADHPFAAGIGLDGGDPGRGNSVTVVGSGGPVSFTPNETALAAQAGYAAVELARFAATAVDAGPGWLTFHAVVADGITQVLLTGPNTARIPLTDSAVLDVTAAGLTATAPTGSTADRLWVWAGVAIDLSVRVADGSVRFTGYLRADAGPGVDAVTVAGGPGDDTFTVTPGPLPVVVDGGPHAAGDTLVLVGSAPGVPTPGAGTLGTTPSVTYQGIELFRLGATPAASADLVTTAEGQSVTVSVLANDGGLSDGPVLVTVTSPPAYGTTQVVGSSVVYTPTPGTNPPGGTDAFSYRVEDANGEASVGTVTVTVTPVNDPPVAFPQGVVLTANGSAGITLVGDDGDADVTQQLTFTILTAPAHGVLSGFDPAAGRVTYTPNPGYDGPDTFTYTVTDDATAGGPARSSSAATVFLQVNRQNRSPVAVADSLVAAQGSVAASPSGGVRQNDYDPDGDPLTVSLVSGPAHGTLTLDRRGTYTYAPAAGFHGTDSFVYAVTDPQGASATATVSITVTPVPTRLIATGAGAGGGPHVKVFDAETGAELYSFFAYDPSFRGGVRVAVGDVNGDGVPDIITTPGPGGGPQVRVFSGADLTELASFFAYDPSFRSGANVSAGDLDGDGIAEVVTGAAPGGGSHVRSFHIRPGAAVQLAGPLGSFFAFDTRFTGGVNVAVGDYDGVTGNEIIVGAATEFPEVRVFGRDGTAMADFLAFGEAGVGITVAAGDVDGDGKADIVVGPGDGGGPVVRTFRGGTAELLGATTAFDPDLRGGISVATIARRTVDGRAAVMVAPTEQARSVLVLDPTADALLDLFDAYAADFPGGVFVGAG